MRDLRKTEAAFRVGDSITTPEMEVLLAWYTEVLFHLDAMSKPEYRLVQNDVRQNAMSLEGYLKSRRERA